ncbi:hypothetical protein [Legionella hackeliae]|uniref:hypothetical protein n=1 Tax=Legionella hackeliae TaxID=449 RepID=UPI000698B97A|nr:hypothetical protein [Legionella hackeliae]KTD10125.1 hypothetical protein Lhac_2493 [Legionella hackeliae]STX49530.1 Uncharacterised protein [Legionella hackeliae]
MAYLFAAGTGGGGGGGESGGGSGSDEWTNDETYTNEDGLSPDLKPTPVEAISVSSFLDESEVWHESSEEDLLYLFEGDLAILSLSLDLSHGLITFKGDENLNQKDQADLDALYDAINGEFKQFAKELNDRGIQFHGTLTRENNNLFIQIPDKKQYDAFVTRLTDKNLIPTRKVELDLTQSAKQKIVADQDFQAEFYKSPTPYDISRGPKLPE